METLERMIAVAKNLLCVEIDEEHQELWLWERAQRVAQLARYIAQIPELADQSTDQMALTVAGLFHCAALAAPVREHRASRWQLLTRPTSDIQRELSAALLQEHVGHLLASQTARIAGDAIRLCNHRDAELTEAHVLAEAENLDDVCVLYTLRQYRTYLDSNRPLQQIRDTWERQREYHYWEARIQDGLRYETTRQLARARVAANEAQMNALADALTGDDVARSLREAGLEPPAPLPFDATGASKK